MRAGVRCARSAASRCAAAGWPAWISVVRNPAGGVRFLFDCGRIGDEALAGIVVQPEEISEYRLAAVPDALALLRGPVRRRVRAATGSKRLIYLEDGRPVPGVGSPARGR
jgi:hypothetical protein